MTFTVPNRISVHLQGVGTVPGCPAGELRIGDEVMWNYGGRTRVTAIEPKGKASVTVTFEDPHTGRLDSRVKRIPALMAGIRDGEWIGGQR